MSRRLVDRLGPPRAFLVALTVCIFAAVPTTASGAAGAMGGGVKKFSPQDRAGKSVTFRVVGVKASKVRRGYVRAGRYTRPVRTARLKRVAARSGNASRRIAVRLPARGAESHQRVRLVVLLRKPRTSKPRHRDPVSDVGTIEQPPADQPASSPEAPAAGAAPTPSATEAAPTPSEPVTAPGSQPVTAPEGRPAPQPGTVPAGEKATTRPVGSPILGDADAAARVRRSSWEPRPGNAAANQRTPRPGELDVFLRDNISIAREHKPLVTGNFTGTTDEIIQWAAWKWGVDEDILRAVAVNESWWRMSDVGDGGLSFGLTQIKITYHAGTQPLSSASTAFNLDYYGALFRYYYEGHARWLNDMDKGQDYAAGDVWGAVGAHYAGRWHTPGAKSYIDAVKRHLDQRTWESRDF